MQLDSNNLVSLEKISARIKPLLKSML